MKKYVFLFLMIMMGYQASSFAQAVDDRAVIPVAVTLNSILRLNVKSGGNIEFNFNTLDQYENGITNSQAYDTKISVASSVNWQLKMGAEDAQLISTDTIGASGSLPLDYIGYEVTSTAGSNSTFGGKTTLKQITDNEYIITNDGTGTGNAGDVNQNEFTINWECATADGGISGPLLGQNYAGGRYATNVFLILERDPN